MTLPEVVSILKTANPGDSIVVEDGVYADVSLKWIGQGNEASPIVIEAATPGQVVVTGKSSMQLAASNIVIRGFFFNGVEPVRKAVVEFAIGGQSANHCRLTECAFFNCNVPKRDEPRSYVILSGRYNRVDHCSLFGKLNIGVTLTINLNGDDCIENHHSIDHNHFGPRGVYGSNGAETIRIGLSQQSYLSSNTIVEENLFERCSGEVEVISVKSSDNVIRCNVLLECEGVVALRHGRRNLVEENVFIGNGRRNTGGVRIVDEGHRVVNNIFYELAGEHFFAALAVMDGVPNSLPNRYVAARNVEIRGNTYVNCGSLEIGTGKDSERTEAPTAIAFVDNKIINGNAAEPFNMVDTAAELLCRGNMVCLSADYWAQGFRTSRLSLPTLPSDSSMRDNRGASWFDVKSLSEQPTAEAFEVRCDGNMPAVVENAPVGSVIILTAREYVLTEPIIVDKPLTIKGDSMVTIRYAGDTSADMIVIANGGSLDIGNIVFDCGLETGKRLASSCISTADVMNRTYTLSIDNCVFRNSSESSFCAVKGGKGTFAESVTLANCLFCDNSGNGIDFSSERDDGGRYNAEDIVIRDCTFRRFLGIPVNIYRGGNDESTAGPYVTVSDCSFDDCCNRQRGSAMRLIGPQYLDVSECTFVNSGRGGASIRLDEGVSDKITIHGCKFNMSGRVMTSTDCVKMYDNVFNDE